MKNPDRETVASLTALPNVGKAIARDLELVGVMHPKDLVGNDPLALYRKLCETTGVRHDPCVLDVFMSVVHFMDGGEAQPWWNFTSERKAMDIGDLP